MKLTGQKMGVGTYTDKPFVCITHLYVNHRIFKRGVGAYTEMGAYSREYGATLAKGTHVPEVGWS